MILLSAYPTNAYAWNNKGSVLHGLNRPEEPLAAYGHAVELDPVYASAWNDKAHVMLGLKHYDEALESVAETIRLEP